MASSRANFARKSLSDLSPRLLARKSHALRNREPMSAGAEPGAVSNGATGSGECREPEGSVPLPTSAECPFGRLYCKVFARTGDLSLAGDARRKTKKAAVVNDIGRKGLDRSNPVVAAVLSGVANGCEFCHRGCYQFYRQKKPPYVCAERGEWQQQQW